jgi:hypothetical protein
MVQEIFELLDTYERNVDEGNGGGGERINTGLIDSGRGGWLSLEILSSADMGPILR